MLALFGERKLVEAKIPATLREFGMNDAGVDAAVAAGLSLKVFPQAVAALRGVDFRSKLAATVSRARSCCRIRLAPQVPVRRLA